MRALISLVCITLILIICTTTLALAGDIPHQYGIELRGGYGLYLNNIDPDTYVEKFQGLTANGYSQKEFTESSGALSGGISLLYKSEEYLGWHIGLNVIGTDSATALATSAQYPNQDQQGRVYYNATELFMMVHYYWNLSPRFNFQFGAGPAFYFASLDLEALGAEQQYGESFYGAHGRNFGFRGSIGAEFFLSNVIALNASGGLRWAPIDRFKYFIEVQSGLEGEANIDYKKAQIAYWPNSYDTFEIDLTGVFLEVGLRFYFDPLAKWKQYE
jgi:hypothetical protein